MASKEYGKAEKMYKMVLRILSLCTNHKKELAYKEKEWAYKGLGLLDNVGETDKKQ